MIVKGNLTMHSDCMAGRTTTNRTKRQEHFGQKPQMLALTGQQLSTLTRGVPLGRYVRIGRALSPPVTNPIPQP